MDTAATLAALASGGVIGLILGLVGGGGSILAVPLLIYVVGVGSPHAAIGTAAVAVTVNALASLVGHARAGRVKWRCASVFAVSGMIGAALGAECEALAERLEERLARGEAIAGAEPPEV